jgi:single-stranded DNA-specific DHH superfamily exonuclease
LVILIRLIIQTPPDSHSATSQQETLIVPDKDADGLSAGVMIHRTLVKLGLEPSLLDVHLVQKGSNIHEETERKAMLEKYPKYVVVLDQGSRRGPPVIDSEDAKCMIIDHHLSDEFPENAVVSAQFVTPTWFLIHDNSLGRFWLPLPTSCHHVSYGI